MFAIKNKNQNKQPRVQINTNAWLNAAVKATKANETGNQAQFSFYSKQAQLIAKGVLR
jgi:hypothetical protein